MRLTLSATGPRPAAEVWERYARPSLWPTWSPQIRRVSTDAARVTAGTTGVVHGPVGVRVAFEVTAWDDDARRWSWRVRPLPGLSLRLDHGVDDLGDATRTWLRVDGPAVVVLPYAAPARWALHRLVT